MKESPFFFVDIFGLQIKEHLFCKGRQILKHLSWSLYACQGEATQTLRERLILVGVRKDQTLTLLGNPVKDSSQHPWLYQFVAQIINNVLDNFQRPTAFMLQ